MPSSPCLMKSCSELNYSILNHYNILYLVRLEEGGVLTDCSIQTQEPDETLDFDFSSVEVLNKIIMKVRRRTLFIQVNNDDLIMNDVVISLLSVR